MVWIRKFFFILAAEIGINVNRAQKINLGLNLDIFVYGKCACFPWVVLPTYWHYNNNAEWTQLCQVKMNNWRRIINPIRAIDYCMFLKGSSVFLSILWFPVFVYICSFSWGTSCHIQVGTQANSSSSFHRINMLISCKMFPELKI